MNHKSLGLTLEQRWERTLCGIWHEEWPKQRPTAKHNWTREEVTRINTGPGAWPNVAIEPVHTYIRVYIDPTPWKPYTYHSPSMPDATGEPLTWCPRHKLHESRHQGAYAYCPWVDRVVGPKLRALEERLAEKKRETKASKSNRPLSVLARMGLAI